ncbi:MAG: SPOR domain-containing protein [Candidatus Sumerlaeia bacterium]|nr:SPOR domain-containing protein [Candidatus Sumerlaeia bacterium]
MSITASAQEPLFSDSFSIRQGERPPSWTAIAAPTPRFWFVENNELASGPGQDLGGDGYSYAIISAAGSEAWTDYSISTEFWMRSRNGRVAVVARWRDAKNYYEGYIQAFRDSRSAFIDVIRNGERKTLAYGVNGVGVDIPSFEGGSRERRHSLQLTVVGPIMGLYLNGKRLVEATDNTLDRGTAGLGVQYNMVYFDNVVVAPAKLVGPTAVPPRIGPAAGSGQIYRFLMGTFDMESEAKRFQSELIGGGYLNVTVEPAGKKWDVLVGAFQTEAEAENERAHLESQGVLIPSIVVRTAGTTQYSPIARRRAALPEKVYTLFLGSYNRREDAAEVKRKLELDGFFGSEIRAEGTTFALVLGSFRTREDAEKYRRLLTNGQYPPASILEEKPGAAPPPAVIAIAQVPQAIAQSDIWKTLTPEQQKEFERLIQQSASGVDPAEIIMDFKKDIQALRLETRQQISDLVKGMEARESKSRQLTALFHQVNKAAFANNFDEARKVLKQILEIDPDNSMVGLIEQQLDLRQNTLGRTIESALSEAQKRQLDRELVAAKQRAEMFERDQFWQNAVLEYETMLSLLVEYNLEPQTQAQIREKLTTLKTNIALSRRREIEEGLTTLTKRLAQVNQGLMGLRDEHGQLRSAFEEKVKFIPYLVGVLGGLTLVVLWIFFGMRRRNRLLLEQMRSLTLKPMMEIAGAGAAASGVLPGAGKVARELSGGAPPAIESKSPPPPPPKAEPSVPTLDGMPFIDPLSSLSVEETPVAAPEAPEVSRPKAAGPTPAAPTLVAVESEAESESPFLESLSPKAGQPSTGTGGIGAPAGLSVEEEEEIGLMGEHEPLPQGSTSHVPTFEMEPEIAPLRLDELTGEVESTAPAGISGEPPLPVESIPLDLEMMGVGTAEPEAPPESQPARAGGFAPGVFYEQLFDDEPDGAMPRNWEGSQESYGFASLKVVSESPAPNSAKCMKFEKTDGVGSAYYSCKFPDATGQVAIEFDLCCDRKNKFLLGFYVEKDGDFRQSVHTIVHQPDAGGAASLRIQGEPVPYEMGTWRHIKYIVNLTGGRLTGVVNGETILDNIRLTNCPRTLNTLSIRDNIPTTGVLRIDNIRITRA